MEESPKGYPLVANFASSDRNFLQFRGFLELHTRVVLDVQYEIEVLEKELNELDGWDAHHGDDDRRTCLTSNKNDRVNNVEDMPDKWQEYPEFDFTRTRPVVLAELRRKLMEYGGLGCLHHGPC